MNEIVTLGALVGAGLLIGALFKANSRADRPEPIVVSAPPPRVYAVLKRALSGFYAGEHHFRIVTADPTNLTIRAVMEWRERIDKDFLPLYPQGFKLNQIMLDVAVFTDRQSKQTKVEIRWTIYSLFLRGRVALVQKLTMRMLEQEIAELNISAQKARQSSRAH